MSLSLTNLPCRALARALALAAGLGLAPGLASAAAQVSDYIVAVVGRELVTASEVNRRVEQAQREASRSGQRAVPVEQLRADLTEQLIQERAQLAYARDSGLRIEDPELDRALANLAAANKLSPAQMRQRLEAEGSDYNRFRAQMREQLLLERVREREVRNRIRVSDAELDRHLDARSQEAAPPELHLAQVLLSVAEDASPAQRDARRREAEAVLARARAGESFEELVRQLSDGGKERGGTVAGGLRAADRLPDLFVEAVQGLRSGQLAPRPVESAAGFHVIKLIERREGGVMVTQHRARHILIRTNAQLPPDRAAARLRDLRQQIVGGRIGFAQAAREVSEDSSAPQGGELGWASPGQFVPEFEKALDALRPGEISEPVVSRFGVHLIEAVESRRVPVERRQLREFARNALREQKYDAALEDWTREVRARVFVERREPPR